MGNKEKKEMDSPSEIANNKYVLEHDSNFRYFCWYFFVLWERDMDRNYFVTDSTQFYKKNVEEEDADTEVFILTAVQWFYLIKQNEA